MSDRFDAFLLVGFGGPEGREDVIPFLERVTAGRNVPRDRLEAVAEHYYLFDGVSPINQQNRDLLAAIEKEFANRGVDLPVYWGNRNWHPLLPETIEKMAIDGVKNAVAFVTSAYSSYSSCRQYRENISDACNSVPNSPSVEKITQFYNQPKFVQQNRENIGQACGPILSKYSADQIEFVFTAHSIPQSMADTSMYSSQLNEAAHLVMQDLGVSSRFSMVYQSRSGPPAIPWLAPDICDFIDNAQASTKALVVVPIGFVSDHLEVIFDLDIEAAEVAARKGIEMVRVPTVGTGSTFVSMIVDMVENAIANQPSPILGSGFPEFTPCTETCCPSASMLAALQS